MRLVSVKFPKAGIDWFTPALLLMILFGWLFPGPGLKTGMFSIKQLAGYGISVIFFLYGLRLSLGQLVKCAAHWKLHLVIQSVTFIIFPLLILIFRKFFADGEYGEIWLGVFFLAALPSTVSSAVVMVSLAGGNIPGAVFNATFSSIAGILITPLWMGLFIQGSGGTGLEILPVFTRLAYQILFPLAAGVALHPWLGDLAIRKKDFTRYFDQSVILAIVYSSFSASFSSGVFSGIGLPVILLLMLALLGLFALVNLLITIFVRRAGLPREDLIAALFCGSTKSLMHGSVMAKVLFSNVASAGLLLLPVLMYHAMQLALTGMMSQRFAAGKSKHG
ncbi:predicted Na+-dependent transporter [Lentimicrobium saccharophilum]|uniref:Predicted Na+-dependent transporter n=1 Tax=Lentimicrobium saccharophilum TaxID=1678841 RepID=A0A0S7C2B3_9BACT|nr:bile acid:sodium symporter family protein [Lentimicrobium saccharophilum]GAP44286.1 predicted Na+-dependent transporter [Lentimicrobium saccharophilum]